MTPPPAEPSQTKSSPRGTEDAGDGFGAVARPLRHDANLAL